MEKISRNDCGVFLAAFIEKNDLSVKKVSNAITCSKASLNRIIGSQTLPSDEMLRQSAIMIELGFKSYSKLSVAEKEKISEILGVVGGGTVGIGAVTAAVSALGLAGLSAAGITSGLAALGAIIGGGMVAGLSVAAAIPLGVAALGYGTIKAVKATLESYKSGQEKIDPRWEMPLEVESENAA
jgi:hypothetical protein